MAQTAIAENIRRNTEVRIAAKVQKSTRPSGIPKERF
jgi:hypothetical protein